MSSSDRRTFLIGSALAVAGCGFTPAYGPDGSAAGLRSSIVVDAPSDFEGFVLVRQLDRRLGTAEQPLYRLSAEIRISDQGVGILPDQTITRYNVSGQVDYRLTRIDDDSFATSGQVRNFTSYSATSTTVATTAAQRDARERLMISLADQIVTELLASAADWMP